MYVVSACLLGADCKYNGGNNRNDPVLEFLDGKKILAVCPETAGGLKAPREPAEQQGGRVLNRAGEDLTEAFIRGAEICLGKALDSGEEIEGAVLKANSPSCGSCVIYDGTFTGTLTEGDGVFAKMLKDRGIKVLTEEEIEKELKK